MQTQVTDQQADLNVRRDLPIQTRSASWNGKGAVDSPFIGKETVTGTGTETGTETETETRAETETETETETEAAMHIDSGEAETEKETLQDVHVTAAEAAKLNEHGEGWEEEEEEGAKEIGPESVGAAHGGAGARGG